MAQYARIFAALDGGSTQEAVARRAVQIAHNSGAELLFGHVIDSVPYEANGIDFAALCEDGKKNLEHDLASVLAEARDDASIASVDLKVHAGRITDTLAESLI